MITTISNVKLTAKINSRGAELFSLRNNDSNREYIWEGNPDFWPKHSPVLFPIVGTLKNNSYTFDEKEYQLLRHGFARDSEFKVIRQNDNEVTLSLYFNTETKKLFPFQFELFIKYSLFENELKISYGIANLDIIKIPFSIGAHPAFALPLAFENYSLEFESQEILKCYTLENDLISDSTFNIELDDKKMPLSYSIFENDALIFKKLNSKFITILENQKPLLKVLFSDFENLGLWTKPNAKFICIEPWLGYSDTIHSNGNLLEKEGIQFVNANESYDCNFSIQIL